MTEWAESLARLDDIAFVKDLAHEAKRLRVPMTHMPLDAEFMPVLSYRVDQEIAASTLRLHELQRLRDRYTA